MTENELAAKIAEYVAATLPTITTAGPITNAVEVLGYAAALHAAAAYLAHEVDSSNARPNVKRVFREVLPVCADFGRRRAAEVISQADADLALAKITRDFRAARSPDRLDD